MPGLRLGVLLWAQATPWGPMLDAAQRVEALGYDHLWTWDHVYAIYGDPYQDYFEGPSVLAAWAVATRRVRLGLLVGANTFRNPGLYAKQVATLDHVSGGRAIAGLGAAWFDLEHHAHGIAFGSGFGERLDWLHESVGLVRRILDGETVTHHGPRYDFDEVRHHPLPVQRHLPIMIGGEGERKTLRTVATYADMWNASSGNLERLRHKDAVLRRHCADVGRDESAIERTVSCKLVIRDDPAEARRVYAAQLEHNRCPWSEGDDVWLGTPAQIAERLRAFRDVGFSTLIPEMPAPYDVETLERLIGEVKPMVDAG